MKSNSIEVRPVSGALGAEVCGVDLGDALSDEQVDTLRRAFLDHQVIFFRGQSLDPDSHKEVGRHFGDLNIHGYYESLPGHPEILPVLKEPEATGNIGGVWHSDVTYLPAPALGSILYALEVPPAGGDTMFASQYLAWETLSDGMKDMLEGLRAIHSSDIFTNKARRDAVNATRTTKLNEVDETIESSHPVVRTHPETGRKCLFVNGAFTRRIDGWTAEESRPLLDFLYRQASRPEFTCRFRWEEGSIAFWDNRCTQHYALNDYQGHRRSMHRVTLEGDRPV